MPKRADLQNVVILGAGPIVIGQACEFDYAGTQACKALREDGIRVVLINSNPATIMTDPETADTTYIEPVTPASVRAVIEKELAGHPGESFAVLPTMGGQVALNVALSLADSGYLASRGIELLGAVSEVIRKAEDRELFREAMRKIGIECACSTMVTSQEEGLAALESVGLPAILRPSFTLGGTGGGIAETVDAFTDLLARGLEASPSSSVLVEESLLGWKEFELEVVRDRADNAIVVCSIENIDPMGVHTGDSITVAPALTLTDREFQAMRDRAIACMREVGVETGGSNVQFAVNPDDGRQVLIEMNPRVSRSSALASKATGFPIARVATKLAIGYTLDEIANEITGTTPASFEPTIDYVVTKIPRFDFVKFPDTAPVLGTEMKSVGEAMAIGRNFSQSMQKALRSLEIGFDGFDETGTKGGAEGVLKALEVRSPMRILLVAEALRRGCSSADISARSGIDRWFVDRIGETVRIEGALRAGELSASDPWDLLTLKKAGLADARIAALAGRGEAETLVPEIRAFRRSAGVSPVIKRIDTCAGEFRSRTAYMYSAYEGDGVRTPECEADVSNRRKIAVLGSGPNRIGQGIEFDYCCVHACTGLAEIGYETIMVNCNPETVSTDYDTADRLYFEPLTAEDVVEVLLKEQERGELVGVMVQFGGQTPLSLAKAIEEAGIPVLGTSPDTIDLCEDRERCRELVDRLGLSQPPNRVARSAQEAADAAGDIGYPVVIRPSYVLGGRAMRIVGNEAELGDHISSAVSVSNDRPVLVEGYLSEAVECDVDAIADGKDVRIAGVLEHVEPAGIHSGDSSCVYPPYSLPKRTVAEIERQTVLLARELGVVGLMNVQFAVQRGTVYLIEINPRASRTVPFIAKARGIPYARDAAKIAAGVPLGALGKRLPRGRGCVAAKVSVLPFKRFGNSDPLLGPEMRSTGEVMGFGRETAHAFARAQEAAGFDLERDGAALVLSLPEDRAEGTAPPPMVRTLAARGIPILAPDALCGRLRAQGATGVRGFAPDAGARNGIQIVLDPAPRVDPVSRAARRFALRHGLPCFTSQRSCDLAVEVLTRGAGPGDFRHDLQTCQ